MKYLFLFILANIFSIVCSQTVLDPPVLHEAMHITYNSFGISWQSVEGATGYKLHVDDNADFSSIEWNFDGESLITGILIAHLRSNTTYYFRVCAFNDEFTSNYSDTLQAHTLNMPATVADPASDIKADSFVANWEFLPSTLCRFKIDVDDNIDFSSPLAEYNDLEVVFSKSKVISGLNSGTEYYYRVRTFDTGSESENSNIISVVTLPATPLNVNTNYLAGSIIISWDEIPGAESYKIYASDDPQGSFFDVSDTGEFAGASWSRLPDQSESKMFYRVVAVDE